MKTGWLVAFIFMFVLCQLIFNVVEMAQPLDTSTPTGFQRLLQPGITDFSDPISGTWSILVIGWTFLQALWDMFWWNYPAVFSGTWIIAKYVIFFPISLGLAFSIIMAFRGTGSN